MSQVSVCQLGTRVSHVKMAEPVEMPFGGQTHITHLLPKMVPRPYLTMIEVGNKTLGRSSEIIVYYWTASQHLVCLINIT